MRLCFVTAGAAALDKCSAAVSGRDAEGEVADEALHEMETSHSTLTSQCSEMLKVVE